MNDPIQSLISDLNLRRAEDIQVAQSAPSATSTPIYSSDPFAELSAGGVHEFFSAGPSIGHWYPPLALLASMACRLAAQKYVLWVGRRCWPNWYFLQAAGGIVDSGTAEGIYFDPLSAEQWLDGIVQAARCRSVSLIVASTTEDIPLSVGRRLQLAAEAGQTRILLARPMNQSAGHCWALTRWHIRPRPSAVPQPQWDIHLVTAKKRSARPVNQWTASWNYEVVHGAGYMRISPALGSGTRTTAAPIIAAKVG